MVERPNNVKILVLNCQAIPGFAIVWLILLLQDIIEHNEFLQGHALRTAYEKIYVIEMSFFFFTRMLLLLYRKYNIFNR